MRYRKFTMLEEGVYKYDHSGRVPDDQPLSAVFDIAKCKPGDIVYIGDFYLEYEGGTYCQANLGLDQMGELYSQAVRAERAAAGV